MLRERRRREIAKEGFEKPFVRRLNDEEEKVLMSVDSQFGSEPVGIEPIIVYSEMPANRVKKVLGKLIKLGYVIYDDGNYTQSEIGSEYDYRIRPGWYWAQVGTKGPFGYTLRRGEENQYYPPSDDFGVSSDTTDETIKRWTDQGYPVQLGGISGSPRPIVESKGMSWGESIKNNYIPPYSSLSEIRALREKMEEW